MKVTRFSFATVRRHIGIGLAELVVALGVMSIVVMGAFKVFHEGIQLFRTNQRAAEAQASVLKVLSSLGVELTKGDPALIGIYADPSLVLAPMSPLVMAVAPSPPADKNGIVFASPLGDNGKVSYDETTGKVIWRKYVSYYLDSDEHVVYRKEMPIPDENPPVRGSFNLDYVLSDMTSRTTGWFAGASGLETRKLGVDISKFEVTDYVLPSGAPTPASGEPARSYDFLLEAGKRGEVGPQSYFISVRSRISPRG